MADASIVKLRLDGEDYESNLKSARQGLLELEMVFKRTKISFTDANTAEREYIGAMGKMSTVSQDARGRINEMTKAMNTLKGVYSRMTSEEKQSHFGALTVKSMEELKGRIADARLEMQNMKDGNSAFGSVLDSLAGKFGLNANQLTTLGASLAAVTAATKVAKDAFFSNEAQLDEWGRVVESSQSLYRGFLDALNGGSTDGFLKHINNIVNAAREAYDALDALGTYNAFNQINQIKAQSDFQEAGVAYREGTGSKENVQRAAEAYKNELRQRQKLEQEAYEKKLAQTAAERGVDPGLLKIAMSGNYGNYEWLKSQPLTGGKVKKTVGGGMFGSSQTVEYDTAANNIEKLGAVLRRLNDTELQSLQALGAQAIRTDLEITQIERQTLRTLNAKVYGESATPTANAAKQAVATATAEPLAGSIDAQTKAVQELQKAWRAAADDDSRRRYKDELEAAKIALDMLSGSNIGVEGVMEQLRGESPSNPFAGMTEVSADKLKNIKVPNLAESGEATAKAWKSAASAIGGVGEALSAIDNPAARVAGIVAEAIANIAATFAASLKGTFTPWDWIAGAAAGTATMISTIAAIKSATAGSYEHGGTIPGNSYTGDKLLAWVNSGETILTRGQSEAVASRLDADGRNAYVGNSKPYLDCETMWLGLSGYLRRIGRGEIVTTR